MKSGVITQRRGGRYQRGRAFTILELLVVMGIIAVLVSILLPAVTRIRETSKALTCESNVRTLIQGMLAFAVDNDNRLPGNYWDRSSSILSHQDFLFGNQTSLLSAPQRGTLFPYVGSLYTVYLCPSGQSDTGVGGMLTSSNGRFDYGMFAVWTGARIQTVNTTSRMYWPDGHFDELPTPIIVQEGANEINAGNQEGAHSNIDLISHVHFGGSYYGAIDGSVQFVNESPANPSGQAGCWVWKSRGPSSGQLQTMATNVITWGFWDSQ